MEYKGSLAYEEPDFLEAYLKRRARRDSPNNAIEGPMINGLLGTVKSSRILDIGCGDGQFGLELLGEGAESYTGVEGSAAMFELASVNNGVKGYEIDHSNMETFKYPAETYDVVVSRMAFHYIENIETVFHSINHTLKNDGKFVFSVQHPLTTASFKSKINSERKEDWIVDDYFEQGERKEPWIGKTVVKYHRTIEFYVSSLTAAGFKIETLKEGTPDQLNFASEEEFNRRKRIPIILAFSCTKTGNN